MRPDASVSVALATLTSLASFWLLLFWLYRDYCVDRFRQDLFALRDDLFDFAHAGRISFEHPAYGVLRSTMNGFIRFAHRFTLLEALLFVVIARGRLEEQAVDSFSGRWERASRTLDAETRDVLLRYRMRMNVAVLRYVLLSSPILLMSVIIPLAGWVALSVCMKQLLEFLRSPLEGLDSAAMAEGQT